MIVDCDVYVVGRGFIHVSDVSPGDRVYTLNGLVPEISRVQEVQSEFIRQSIHRISTGMQRIEATKDTLYLYVSEINGLKYIKFAQIDKLTPNKEYRDNKYLPVLGGFMGGDRNFSDQQLEEITRLLLLRAPSCADKIPVLASQATGTDAFVFMDLVEHWLSDNPGIGRFGKLNRKSRAFFFNYDSYVDDFCLLAMKAGWLTQIDKLPGDGAAVNVFYDSSPVPGDVPKNEKYVNKYYVGNVYGINSHNRPIWGRFERRAYFLPFTSDLYNKV